MLGNLTETQRRTLERWILHHKSVSLAQASLPASTAKMLGGFGVHRQRRAGRKAYRAGVNIGPFRLHTGYYSDIAEAQQSLEALLRIQRNVREQLAQSKNVFQRGTFSNCGRLEAAFRSALQLHRESLLKPSLSEFRFITQIPAKRWVGRALATPSYPTMGKGLDRGLEAWRRLVAARGQVPLRANRYTMLGDNAADLEAAWKQLRSAYVRVCVDAGHSPNRVSSRLLRWEGVRSLRQLNGRQLKTACGVRSSPTCCKDYHLGAEQFARDMTWSRALSREVNASKRKALEVKKLWQSKKSQVRLVQATVA